MTKAAAHFGKDLSHFMRSPDMREYVDALNYAKNAEYVETSRGRHGGTWAHPKLAVFFARWLYPRPTERQPATSLRSLKPQEHQQPRQAEWLRAAAQVGPECCPPHLPQRS